MIRFLTAGESHGKGLIVILEGLPAGVPVKKEYIDFHLARRQRGYGRGERMRIEQDECEIISGIRFGKSMGSPVALQIKNRDWENWSEQMDSETEPDSLHTVSRPRPGHGDYAGIMKYELNDIRDISERASARETAARVAAGAVVRAMLDQVGFQIASQVLSIGGIEAQIDWEKMDELLETAESSPVGCADMSASMEMMRAIDRARTEGDTLGGTFAVIARGIPVGLGSHVHWDRRLDGKLAQAILSIPGIKGVEFGLGFAAAELPGSAVHDSLFVGDQGYFRRTNHAGGIEAGISNGEDLFIKAAFKPIPSLRQPLESVDLKTGQAADAAVERSDVCAVPAAAVVAEAMVALIIADAVLTKFGSDSMEAVLSSMDAYKERIHEKWVKGIVR